MVVRKLIECITNYCEQRDIILHFVLFTDLVFRADSLFWPYKCIIQMFGIL